MNQRRDSVIWLNLRFKVPQEAPSSYFEVVEPRQTTDAVSTTDCKGTQGHQCTSNNAMPPNYYILFVMICSVLVWQLYGTIEGIHFTLKSLCTIWAQTGVNQLQNNTSTGNSLLEQVHYSVAGMLYNAEQSLPMMYVIFFKVALACCKL